MTSFESIMVRCPRCGYDQRGQIATWAESCPLKGVCAECGLTFIWSEMLCPEKYEPRWCIEFEPRRSRIIRAAVRTFARSFLPWRFWSRLTMANPIRWPRLIVYMLLLALPLLMTYVMAQTSIAILARQAVQDDIAARAQSLPFQIQHLQRYRALVASGESLANLDDQARQLALAGYDAQITAHRAAIGTIESIDLSAWRTTLETLAQPLGRWSSALIVSPGGARPYPAPIDQPGMAFQSTPLRSSTYFLIGGAIIAVWLIWGAGIAFSLPISFVFLPFSLRRAKVRYRHLMRIAVYSLIIPATCITLAIGVMCVAWSVFASDEAVVFITKASRYVPWLAVALSWQAATSRYLKRVMTS